jgi:hypothetical protein
MIISLASSSLSRASDDHLLTFARAGRLKDLRALALTLVIRPKALMDIGRLAMVCLRRAKMAVKILVAASAPPH